MNFINNKDKVGSGLFLLFSLAYLNASFDIPLNKIFGDEVFTARTLPVGLSIISIVCCLIHLLSPAHNETEESIKEAVKGFHWKPCISLIGLMFVYGLTFQFFGFVLATFLFLLAGFSIMREKRYVLSSVIAAGIVFLMWFFLTQIFDIYLDAGSLYRIIVGGD
ncbi:tripartite tricarboxylate transporter TctB family protein [Agarilytica rhodophyticola]|uniref:tripartite tricarboxylate transporter TctB family protein n=1 Tax=Agarilytica rhodophyticola TaxID=1737490 RepID=UPI000B348D5C|nr:tripartite tricarboxylate transporter TctB family protein [Agarilytica rhodophyticola]